MQDDLFSGEHMGRRVFVKGMGFVSLAFAMGMFGGCEPIIDAIKNRPVRRRLRVGSPEVDADLATYAQAVSLMRGLPDATDGRSWNRQAAIHGTASGFNLCEHDTSEDSTDTNTIQFFSWHRAYLLYFERICQELTGNKKFGLPYWNWNQDPAIHPAFLDPASSLFMARTNTTVAGTWGASSFTTSTLDGIFSDTNYFSFSMQIEGTPHNTLHGVVGQTMGSAASPLDPIFWAHHAMADYCWAKWNLELGNDNPNDPGWTGVSWNYFVDGQGNATNVSAGVTPIMPLLSYRYESSAIGSHAATIAEMSKTDFDKLEKRIREGANIKFDIKKRITVAERAPLVGMRPYSTTLKVTSSDFSTLINTDSAQEKIFASVHYATAPATTDFFVRVFLNMPNADLNTPVEDPHYAGSFAFFGKHGEGSPHHNQGGPRFLVNLSPTFLRLKERQELVEGRPLSMQLVPVPYSGKIEGPSAEIVLEKVDLLITPVIVNPR